MQLAVDRTLGKRIVSLATPVVVAMMSQTLINQVDHILIGRLPSSESIPGQAALGPSLILFWMVGGMLGGVSVGTQALPARRFGENERARAGQVLFTPLGVAPATSGVASVLAWIFAPLTVHF